MASDQEAEGRRWLPAAQWVLAVVVVAACTQPWSEVAFPRLWGEVDGPPGTETGAGLVLALASLLGLLLPALAGKDPQGRLAVATAGMFTAALASLAAVWELFRGPAPISGVSAAHTPWFYVALLASAAVTVLAVLRYRSSGPPMKPRKAEAATTSGLAR